MATRAHAFGMRVLAIDPRRTDRPPEVSELWPPDRLPDLLGASDFVVLCAPETPETRGLFDARVIGMMRPNAYLINIARGKWFAWTRWSRRCGRAPLPVLAWTSSSRSRSRPIIRSGSLENVVITPHVAGAGPHSVERLHAILLDNLRRFVNGEPLMNVIDKRPLVLARPRHHNHGQGRGQAQMGRYLLRRLMLMIPTLIGASIVVFIGLRIVPGDPVR